MIGTEDMSPEECLNWIVRTYIPGAVQGSPAHNRIEKVRAAINRLSEQPTGIGASFKTEDDSWHFHTMPDGKALGLTMKGYNPDRIDTALMIMRRGFVAAEAIKALTCIRGSDAWFDIGDQAKTVINAALLKAGIK